MIEKVQTPNGVFNIDVRTKSFLPEKGYDYCDRKDLILFLGWGPDENAQSYEKLAQSMADNFCRQVHIVNTVPEKIIKDSLFYEAKATANHIEKMKMSDVVIAGYSQGAAKAINLTSILQEPSSTVKPESLVLFAPACINQQSPSEITKRFLLDGLFETIPRILTEKNIPPPKGELNRFGKSKESLKVISDITLGILNKLKDPKKLVHEIKEIAKENSRLEDVKVPVVLFQGKFDKAAGPRSNINYEEIFPNSPYVRRILATRSSNHDFVLVRSGQIARTAAHFLRK